MLNIQFSGIVKPYTGNGRKMGYPTANIEAPEDAPEGVFAGTVTLGAHEHDAMIFIGEPVTLDDFVRRAEAYIYDFEDRDLYGEKMTFTLIKHMRDNRRFDSLELLLEQMHKDRDEIRAYLSAREQ